ncbi:MAG: DUF1553 domain-containing protein [Pirellulaceae bacterium]|nr:DUF1553 domain-containing protein [Pirellulaceae bacterium]
MRTLNLMVVTGLIAGTATLVSAGDSGTDHFEAKVRPVLVEHCSKCHGAEQDTNGLRLDSRQAMLSGGDRGPAIVPGAPQESLLVQAIHYQNKDLQMPPHEQLPEHVIADIVAWIQQGAVWPQLTASADQSESSKGRHWAFQPVESVSPPVDTSEWSEHPIDQFIIAKIRQEGLVPGQVADKRTLVRRIYLDLIGLAPTPAQTDAFLHDTSPDALDKLISRLLASPHYGERWGRHWMDVIRYSDTSGDSSDCPVPEMFRFRDYVIDAINEDKSYDRFLHEQLAGDQLADQNPHLPRAEPVIATGFIALAKRFGTRPYQYRHLEIEDMIDCMGRALVGLTMRCARCHDHKFDPMTNEDYYALYGIFDSSLYSFSGSEATKVRQNLVSLLYPQKEFLQRRGEYDKKHAELNRNIRNIEQEDPLAKQVTELNAKIDDLNKKVEELKKSAQDTTQLAEQLQPLTAERDEINTQLQQKLKEPRNRLAQFQQENRPLVNMVAFAATEGEAKDAQVHLQGDHKNLGEVVQRDIPRFLSGGTSLEIPEGTSGRLQFAQWLTDRNNPLTARVMINRIWHYHFGKGIVGTPSDFGLRGEPPTHPELLDWLAGQFVDQGWSIKAMHRLLMRSKAYRLTSRHVAENAEVDPDNKLYWRYDRRRLDAETIRDCMLAASGNLRHDRPTAHPFPPQHQWRFTQHAPFKAVYQSRHRSVYLMTQRVQRHPFLGIFDGADTNVSTDKRTQSIIPQQALYLMNNPFVREQARGFAQRLITASESTEQRIEQAHRVAWGRSAHEPEIEKGRRYIETYKKQLEADGAKPTEIDQEAWTSFARIMFMSNEFLCVE